MARAAIGMLFFGIGLLTGREWVATGNVVQMCSSLFCFAWASAMATLVVLDEE